MGTFFSFGLNEGDHFAVTCVKCRSVQDCFGIAAVSMRKGLQGGTRAWNDMENTKKYMFARLYQTCHALCILHKSFTF